MRIRRRKKPDAPTTGHYMVRAKTIEIWICVAEHQCGEVRDRYGRPLDIDQEFELTGL